MKNNEKPIAREEQAGGLVPLALRAKDAAQMLGISVRHLRTLAKSGKVPHIRFGKSVRFPWEQLQELLKREAAKSIRRARTRPPEA